MTSATPNRFYNSIAFFNSSYSSSQVLPLVNLDYSNGILFTIDIPSSVLVIPTIKDYMNDYKNLGAIV